MVFILDRLADGWSEADILDNYPHLKREDLQAVFAFVRDCLKDETFIMHAALKSGNNQHDDSGVGGGITGAR